MDLKLKLQLKEAIEKVLIDNSDDNLWEHYITFKLVDLMANACETVFDASMDGQDYYSTNV